jgi:hypothetical protein
MNSVEWANCRSPERILNGIRGRESRRKLRLFTVACCRRFWAILTDERSRLALEAIENHVDGEASDIQLQEASEAAELAFQSQRLRVLTSLVGPDLANQAIKEPGGLFRLIDTQTARNAHDAADSDSASMAASAAWSATASDLELQSAGYSLIDSAIGTANQAAAAASDTTNEEFKQAELLHDIIGDPFRVIILDRQIVTPAVIAMSKQMYDSRDFGSMPTLANALEAVGCHDVSILDHCRSASPHVRGCWVVDLILGKN